MKLETCIQTIPSIGGWLLNVTDWWGLAIVVIMFSDNTTYTPCMLPGRLSLPHKIHQCPPNKKYTMSTSKGDLLESAVVD